MEVATSTGSVGHPRSTRPDAIEPRTTVGFPFFGELIHDCLGRTETAFSRRQVFGAIELALDAQEQALRVEGPR